VNRDRTRRAFPSANLGNIRGESRQAAEIAAVATSLRGSKQRGNFMPFPSHFGITTLPSFARDGLSHFFDNDRPVQMGVENGGGPGL